MRDYGDDLVTVEVDTLAYNPLYERGFQKVEKSDVVSITDELDGVFFNDPVLEADSIVTVPNNTR